jgi:tetratricopeptide (TPR) repeat protein
MVSDTECFDDETIAELLARTLSLSDPRIEAHLDRCDACRRHVSDVVRTAPAPDPDGERRIGGRYRVDGYLGRGGMGEVLRAFDIQLDRDVALKVQRLGAARDAAARERLQREAHAMARLSHPNIVAVYDLGFDGDRVYIAMDLVDGKSLADWSKQRSAREILAACIQAGRGLGAVHAAGLVHRDVTPRNILVRNDGRVQVADFGLVSKPGLARESPATGAAAVDDGGRITKTGEFLGTPAYAAPEVFEGAAADAASDQWGLAATIWEVMAGEPAFRGATFAELARAVTHGEPAESSRLPRPVRTVLRRALARDPARRFPSISTMVDALARSERRKSRWLVAGLLAAGSSAIAIATTRVARESACELSSVDAVWGPGHKTVVLGRFATHGALDKFARLDRGMDSYAAAWTAAELRACEVGDPPRLASLRRACIDDRLTALRALRDGLSGPVTAREIDRALEVVARLPSFAACDDPVALTRSEPAADVHDLRGKLAQIDVLDNLGRDAQAAELAREAVAEARGAHADPWLMKALFDLARSLATAKIDLPAARRALEEAGAIAATLHDDGAAAGIWVELYYVVAEKQQLGAEAAALESVVAAMVARGADPITAAKWEKVLSFGLIRRGMDREAILHAEAAVRQLEARLGPDHLDVATAVDALGTELVGVGEVRRGVDQHERALAIATRLLGRDHYRVAEIERSLALGYIFLDKNVRAELLLEEVRAFDEREHVAPQTHGNTLMLLATAHAQRGDWAVSLEYGRRALALELDDEVRYQTLVDVGSALAELARCPEAQPYLARALELGPQVNLPEMSNVLLPLARCTADRRTALSLFDRGIAAMASDPKDRGDLCFDAAKAALALGRVDQAVSLARDAKTAWSADAAAHADDLARIDGWIENARR